MPAFQRAARPHLEPTAHPQPPAGAPLLPLIEPSWLFLIAGAAMLIAIMLIQPMEELRQARVHRDIALAYEAHRTARLLAYRAFLDRLDNPDPELALFLARTQLNLAPATTQFALAPWDSLDRGASVFPALEPAYAPPPQYLPPDSLLYRLSSGADARLWLMAGSALCILIGLLPTARRRGG